MSLLEMKNIKKSFNGVEVLKDISLKVEKGEVLGIIGPSGSGKSTLLRCATGLETADAGEIHYSGTFGLVFQNFNLFPHYTVEENIVKPLMTVKKMKADEAKEKAKKLLEKVKLSDAAEQYPDTLSGGQKQRVAIARSLAMDPEILAFDEPTSSLDPELAHEVFRTIKELAQEGQTMLIVTHQLNAIKHFATRVAFLYDGKIEVEGNCKEVFEKCENKNLKAFLKMVEFDNL